MKKIFTTLKKWWWLILAIPITLALIPLTKRILSKKDSEKTFEANEVLKKLNVPIALRPRFNKIASDVASYLGTSNLERWYNYLHPLSWFEDDEKAYNSLKGLTQKEFEIVSKVYFDTYAKGRTLISDLSKYLDSKYYSQLNFK